MTASFELPPEDVSAVIEQIFGDLTPESLVREDFSMQALLEPLARLRLSANAQVQMNVETEGEACAFNSRNARTRYEGNISIALNINPSWFVDGDPCCSRDVYEDGRYAAVNTLHGTDREMGLNDVTERKRQVSPQHNRPNKKARLPKKGEN